MPISLRAGVTKTMLRPAMRWIAASFLVCGSPAVMAAVHKCVNADGKVEFSDRACPVAQAGGPGKSLPTPEPGRSDGGTTGTRAACVKMRNRIADSLQNGTGNTPERETRALVARYEAQCADVARQEMRKEDAKEATANAPLRKAQDSAKCNAMRKQ